MKKILAFLIFIAFICTYSIFNVGALSVTITTDGGYEDFEVKATYVPAPDTYKVDITWGAMTYNYTQTWNTSTRTNSYSWVPTNPGVSNLISLSNSSNVAVKATFTWTQGAITGVAGNFSGNNLIMNAPVSGGSPTTASATLTLSGTPSTTSLSNSVVGTVTVTITKN